MTQHAREYRGLDATSPLVLTPQGEPYALSAKRRKAASGETKIYWAADGLQAYVTQLYSRLGFGRGFSSHSGRRTFATRLVEKGTHIETVQALLGHVDLDHVSVYVDVTADQLREAVRTVL